MKHIISIEDFENTLIDKILASSNHKQLILQTDILSNDVRYIIIDNDTRRYYFDDIYSAIKGYNRIQ